MQNPTLPILSSGPSANANPVPRPKNGGEDDGQFSQALSREVGQRQQQDKPQAAPQVGAKPATPAKPQQAQAGDKTAAKTATAEPARAAGGKSTAADAAEAAAEDAAAQAAAGAPALDMLALVASLNLPLTPPPASAAPAADPLAAGAGATAASLQASVAAALSQAGKSATVVPGPDAGTSLPDSGFGNMMAAIDGSVLDGIKPQESDAGHPLGQLVQRVATEETDAKPRAGLASAEALPGQPKAAPDVAQFTTVRTREAAPEAAPPRELQVSAPTTSPVQQASLALAQAANAGASDKIAARVGTPAWDNQVGQKIVWMIGGKEQSATLTLNPPDMGPMQVVLSVNNDHASVTFSAAQPEVRQALEDAMPKLREMMNESGIALGNASVNDGSAQQQAQAQADARQSGSGQRGGNGLTNGSAAEAEAAQAARPRRASESQGLVDTFA